MSHETIALILWSLLPLSLLLTWIGVALMKWRVIEAAAILSFILAVLGIFSIGFIVLLLTLLQVGTAIAVKRNASPRGWAVALGVPVGVWAATIGALLAPYWF